MKKTYSKNSRQGLPGGPNEMFEKVKGIIVSQRGQWDFPGMNTLVPTDDGRITMRGVPYPVYGEDETGYGQMMYPGQEYQFPGNNVLELPMAQRGGGLPKFQGVARSQVPTYNDSLDLYKNTVALENFLRSKKAAIPTSKFEKWQWENSQPIVGTTRNWYTVNPTLSPREKALAYANSLYDIDKSTADKSLSRDNYVKTQNNLIGTRDWATGGGDDKDFPVSYVHPKIKPQFEGDTQIPGEGMFYMYRYDPVAIKPGSLLTPKELALRLKKYGKRGIPQSKIDEYYASKNPVTPLVTPPANIIDINKPNQQTSRKEFVRNINQFPFQLGPNQYEQRVSLNTPLHTYMMNLDQYSKLLPTDSIPQEDNFLYRLNRQQLGGALPRFQYTGQFNPQLARPNPLTGKYVWEQSIPKKAAVNVAPKIQPAARATTNVQKQKLNLDRDNRLLDANLIYSDASSNPLSNAVHTGLDAVGMVPVIGEPADLANALLYNYEGDLENAALSTAGMIPFLGMLGTGKRLLGKATNQLEGYSKGLKQLTPKKEYLTGKYKHHAINELKKTALAFSPSTVKALGKLDPAITQKMLEYYRFGEYPSIEDFRKNVKKATLESERLKKIYPTLDFAKRNDFNYNWLLKKPETLKNYAEVELIVDKSNASQKSFMDYLEKEYSKKMDLINQNEVFKNIANESPQYTDIIYDHLKNPKSSDDEFVTNLVKQSNTFTRAMHKAASSPEEFFTLQGRSMSEGNKNTIDLEGFPVSGDYGNYRYKIEPDAQRMSKILETPIEERWGQRFLNNFTDNNIDFKEGWHNQQSEAYNNWWRKRLNRNRITDYVPMLKYPKEFNVPVKYVVYPQHKIASSTLDNQILKGFNVSRIDIENPYKHIPGFTRGYSLGGSLPTAQVGDEIFPGEGQYYNIPEYTYNYKRGFDDLPTPRYTGPLMNQRLIDEATQREYEQRRRAIEESVAAAREPLSTQRLARESAATGDKFSLQMNLGDPYNNPRLYETLGALDFINPGVMLGDMVTGLGSVPYNVQEGNYGAATFGLGLPLATGALASIGVKTPRQFVNNLVNPVAGIGDTPKQLPGSPNTFKSEIDWGKWNPDTPKYPELINEYNAIEESTKKAGTWMKNPDGSTFQGTPEQFVQQQSSWFKKFYEGSQVGHTTQGSPLFMYHGSPSKNIQYFLKPGEPGYIKSPTTTTGESGIYFSDLKNYADKYQNFADTKNLDGRTYQVYLAPKTAIKAGEDGSLGLTQGIPPSFLWHHKPVPVDAVLAGKAMRKIYPKHGFEVAMENPNLIKSAIGNVGFFDMTNPNIYKALAPVMGIGAGAYGVNQMQDAQPTMKRFGGKLNFQGGGNYNMQRALELGYTPDEAGHYPSVDSETGMWLKSKQHPTAWMESMYGYQLNPEVYNNYNVVYNPEGYFGENQLQYVPKKFGGSLLTAGDPVLNFIQRQSPRFSKSKK